MRTRVQEDGAELNMEFSVQPKPGQWALTVESRGGRERNSDYERGLELLLARVGALGGTLASAEVSSTRTARLSTEERRIVLPDPFALPLELRAIGDVRELRLALGRAQARTGQSPGATGGNPTKRVTLMIRFPREDWAGPSELERVLASGQSLAVGTPSEGVGRVPVPAAQWTPRAAGQGYGDSATNCAVEARAMEVAAAHFSPNYKVDSSPARANKPYDLWCSSAARSFAVEVKGTRSAGEAVLVSRGEVEYARKHRGEVALFVVHSILVAGNPPVATGGIASLVDPWYPEDSALLPVQYLYGVVRPK